MRGRFVLIPLLTLAAAASASPGASPRAVDHGQMGQTWPVIEPDLLSVIKARLDHAQSTGKLDEMNRQFAEKVKQRVMRPVPVSGISRAEVTRSWEFDPSIVVDNDIRDHQGNLIAAAGQRVNPLATSGLSKKLVFVDGDDPDQVEWALEHGDDGRAKVIFVDGSPFELMKVHQRRFYFDQEGKLTSHFGITRTPALVEQKGEVLLVTEQAIARKRGGS
ncbi:MAG: type-F conjugative transfer system protein TraW [Pseudomonadota bacterium]